MEGAGREEEEERMHRADEPFRPTPIRPAHPPPQCHDPWVKPQISPSLLVTFLLFLLKDLSCIQGTSITCAQGQRAFEATAPGMLAGRTAVNRDAGW